jgi:hypothetical protein
MAPRAVANTQASAIAPSPEALAAFDVLSSRAAAIAPGMHEVARKQSAGQPIELVRAETGDACVRVAFTSTAPVTARLVDSSSRVLAAIEQPAIDGVLGERGPVCVRKGDVVTASAEGTGARVAWMAWEAP